MRIFRICEMDRDRSVLYYLVSLVSFQAYFLLFPYYIWEYWNAKTHCTTVRSFRCHDAYESDWDTLYSIRCFLRVVGLVVRSLVYFQEVLCSNSSEDTRLPRVQNKSVFDYYFISTFSTKDLCCLYFLLPWVFYLRAVYNLFITLWMSWCLDEDYSSYYLRLNILSSLQEGLLRKV